MQGTDQHAVAVVGMSGRFPGAGDVGEFWSNLRGGVESIVDLSDEELLAAGVEPGVWDRPGFVRRAPRFEGIGDFDAEFFGYSAREAQIMDPQHRLFLEEAWHALEDAGHDPGQFGGRVGVFGGAGSNRYQAALYAETDIVERAGLTQVLVGNEVGFLASRVSYKLDLSGPAISMRTACSTALVALHVARQSLLSHECDMALAGGVYLDGGQNAGYWFREGGFLSSDGRVRPFDAGARGTVFGSGVGVLVLRRLDEALADGDRVYAVLAGSAVNNDGAVKASFTAPGVAGQAAVLSAALESAGLSASDIDYVEAHGTGTLIGDSIEVQALSRVFRGRAGQWGLGSLKGNVGHLDAASGMAGLFKVILALQHEVMPASLNFESGNPDVDFVGGPFRVWGEARPWVRSDRVRRAGVSAFGFGGTNAHVIVEEAPVPVGGGGGRGAELVVLSARTALDLEAVSDRFAAFLESEGAALSDAAFTLAMGRRPLRFRRVVTGSTAAEVAAALRDRSAGVVRSGQAQRDAVPVVLLFSGQGSQYVGMASELYEDEPVFRDAVDRCVRVANQHLDGDLREVMFGSVEGSDELLGRTEWSQPALFAVEYAVAELWRSWGVDPAAMLGHSLGEYVAACQAGVFTVEDAVAVVCLRGRLMQRMAAGAMMNILAPVAEIEKILPGELSVAAHNGPDDCVISGPVAAVEAFNRLASEQGWVTQMVPSSRAFHSEMMRPMMAEFHDAIDAVVRRPPSVPFVSNVTGTWITDEEAVSADYWVDHVRSTVRFAEGVQAASLRVESGVFLEVGPGRTLTALARRVIAGRGEHQTFASLPHRNDPRSSTEVIRQTLGALWIEGLQPNWRTYYSGQQRQRRSLPTYPFNRRRYWLEPTPTQQQPTPRTPEFPLLGTCVVESGGLCVFQTIFARDSHWILREHALLGESIVPGTTYLEMAIEAGSEIFGSKPSLLRDVEFLEPMLVRHGGESVVQTILQRGSDRSATFRVVSRSVESPHLPSSTWIEHARGIIELDGPAIAASTARSSENGELHFPLGSFDGSALQSQHSQMQFGPRWLETLSRIDVGVHQARGTFELPARFRAEEADYELHPAIMDLATGFGAFAVHESSDALSLEVEDRSFHLPVGYKEVRIHRRLPTAGTSVIHTASGVLRRSELRSSDVTIYDEEGGIAVEVKGFTTRLVHSASATVSRLLAKPRIHQLQWKVQPAPRPSRHTAERVCVLVLGGDATDVCDELRYAGHAVYEARPEDADGYLEGTDGRGPGREMAEAIARGAAELGGLDHLIILAGSGWPIEIEPDGTNGEPGWLFDLFALGKAVAAISPAPTRMTAIARNVEGVLRDDVPRPEGAALFGIAKVIGLESGIEVTLVDIDQQTPIRNVVAHLDEPGARRAVVFRDGRRYAQELQSAPVALRAMGDPLQGVVLITGGLGGLGLAVARHVARTHPGARIALVGRTALPPRSEWPQLIRSGDRMAGRLSVMTELEAAGAAVRTFVADVRDEPALRKVFRRVAQEWEPVRCVVHAAGTAGDGFLVRKDWETFNDTVSPKILGALALERVCADEGPELMVLFGSTAAVLGAAGQADYVAANQFLDTFAERRDRRGQRTISIDWSDWLEIGMASDHGVPPDQGFFRSLSPEQALEDLDLLCRSDLRRAIVGEINFEALSGVLGESLNAATGVLFAMPTEVRETLERRGAPVDVESTDRDAHPQTSNVRLTGRSDGEYSSLEHQLASLWARELECAEIDVNQSTFALGGDSLTALRMVAAIEKTLDCRVSMFDLFQFDSVASLAHRMHEAYSTQGSKEA